MKKMYVLVGPIASGKSTYAKLAAQNGAICVNDDAIVSMVHGDDYTLYNADLKLLYKSIENHVIASGLGMGFSMIIDRGLNVSKAGRERWISLAKSFDAKIEAVVFHNEGPKIHADRRTASDGRNHPPEYWLRVAEVHQSLYSVPTLEEGFDAVNHITFPEIQSGKLFL